MPIRQHKDRSQLKASIRVQGEDERRFYLRAYLWENREAMRAATGVDPSTRAVHCPNVKRLKIVDGREHYVPSPLLGELHFVADDWDEEVVAHELAHALLHRLETRGQGDLEAMEMQQEEAVTHEFGQWFSQVYRWLWRKDPHGKHAGGEVLS